MRTLSLKLPLLGLLALLLVTTVAPVEAGFISYYDVTNWTTTKTPGTSDASVDTFLAPASVTLIGADNEVGPSNLDFTVAAHSNGTVTFNWDYTSYDTWDASWDPFGYLLNGVFTQLTDNGGSSSQSGVVSFLVSSGDIFGFRQASVDSILGRGVTTVSDFNAPVPEPMTLALLGLGLLGGARRLRSRQRLQ